MLENNENIEIIKEILYEESTRQMLNVHQNASVKEGVNTVSVWKWLAAASVIALLSIIGFNFMNNSVVDTSALIAEVYTFPVINKSRGTEINLVDSYIKELNAKQYLEVLNRLPSEGLTEKDQFYKANMFFTLNKFEQANQILDNTNWSDDYYIEESNWLKFLIAYDLRDGSAAILKNNLNPAYSIKAEALLSKVKQ